MWWKWEIYCHPSSFQLWLKYFTCVFWRFRAIVKVNVFNVLYWYCINFVFIPNFPHWSRPGLELDLFAPALCTVSIFRVFRYLLVSTMWIDPEEQHITGIILDPPLFLVFSSLISSSPIHACAMACTAFDVCLSSDSIRHETCIILWPYDVHYQRLAQWRRTCHACAGLRVRCPNVSVKKHIIFAFTLVLITEIPL